MKAQLLPFQTFLKERFQPCIYVQFSSSVQEEDPGFRNIFLSEFYAAMAKSQYKFRVIFPDETPSIEKLAELTANRRFINPKSEPYDFFSKPPPGYACEELKNLAFLRQRLFEYTQLPHYLYLDIPFAFLSIAKADEKGSVNLSSIPAWARSFASKVKAYIIRYPPADFQGTIQRFFEKAVPECMLNLQKDVGSLYRQNQNWKASITDIFVSNGEPSILQIALKRYADLYCSQGKFAEAIRLYYNIVEQTQMDCRIFLGQVHGMLGLCDIMRGKITNETIRNLEKATFYNRLPNHVLPYSLSLFFVKLRLKESVIYLLKEVTQSDSKSPLVSLSKPFCFEQQAVLSKPHKAALLLSIAAENYQQIEARELQMRCLWQCFGIVSREGWELIHQQLIAQIAQSNLRQFNDNLSYYVCDTLRQRKIHLDVLEQFVAASNPKKSFVSGFIRARVVECVSPYFMCSSPRFVHPWFPTAEKLFGAYFRGEFFKMSRVEEQEGSVGVGILFSVNICSDKELEHLSLIFDGNATAESTIVEKGKGVQRFVCTPTKAGTLKVIGISFLWNGCLLRRFFSDNRYCFKIHESIPIIEIESDISNCEMYLGETRSFKLRIANKSDDKLRRLALVIESSIPLWLVDPPLEEIVGGTTLLEPLGPSGEINLTCAIYADKLGKQHSTLMIPYWTENSPPLYCHISIEVNVKPIVGLRIFGDYRRAECIIPSELTPIGFSSDEKEVSMLSIVNNNRAILKKIGLQNEINNMEVPEYAKSTGLTLWLSNRNGFVSVPISGFCSLPCSIVFHKIGKDKYRVTFASYKVLNSVNILIKSNNNDCCIVGKNHVKALQVQKDDYIEWDLQIIRYLTAEAEISCELQAEEFSGFSEVVIL